MRTSEPKRSTSGTSTKSTTTRKAGTKRSP
jgi:hypothetical protein